ncbi:MAG: membrane protein insertion efficiency factor YidD [Planctomycetota bacterium]
MILSRIIIYLMVALIRIYQIAISPVIGNCCRFEPTCSTYFIEALRKKGILKGTILGIYRILRCNPFCRAGYDPVP